MSARTLRTFGTNVLWKSGYYEKVAVKGSVWLLVAEYQLLLK